MYFRTHVFRSTRRCACDTILEAVKTAFYILNKLFRNYLYSGKILTIWILLSKEDKFCKIVLSMYVCMYKYM